MELEIIMKSVTSPTEMPKLHRIIEKQTQDLQEKDFSFDDNSASKFLCDFGHTLCPWAIICPSMK